MCWIPVAGGPGRGEDGAILQSTFGDPRLVVLISSSSLGDFLLYCIKCWETKKRDEADNIEPVPFDSLSRDEKMLRLGVIPSGTSPATLTRNIMKRNELLAKYVDPEMLDTIQQSSPRLYPTTTPMSEETQCEFHQRIIQEDPNQESPTFEGGFEACVKWYRDFISARDL